MVPWVDPRYLRTCSRRGRDLLAHPVIEQDYAVRDVLLGAVPGQLVAAGFPGDDGGQPAVLQPPEQPAQLPPHNRLVRQRGEQRLDRVQHHPLCTDLVDRKPEPQEQALQVVAARCTDLGRGRCAPPRRTTARRLATGPGQTPATPRSPPGQRPSPQRRSGPRARRTPAHRAPRTPTPAGSSRTRPRRRQGSAGPAADPHRSPHPARERPSAPSAAPTRSVRTAWGLLGSLGSLGSSSGLASPLAGQ